MIGDEYVPGALVLAYSLKKVKTKARLIVMVTKDVSEKARNQLKLIFDDIIEVPYVEAKAYQKDWKRFKGELYLFRLISDFFAYYRISFFSQRFTVVLAKNYLEKIIVF